MGILEQLAEIRAEEGREQGHEQGLKEGREETSRLFVENLLTNTDFSPEKIASLVNVSLDFVKNVSESLSSE